jgi:hypothetical protein
MPSPVIVGDHYSAIVAWQGFRFFEIDVVASPRRQLKRRRTPAASTKSAFRARARWVRRNAAYLEYAPPTRLATGYGARLSPDLLPRRDRRSERRQPRR